jgi:hypothetical protein
MVRASRGRGACVALLLLLPPAPPLGFAGVGEVGAPPFVAGAAAVLAEVACEGPATVVDEDCVGWDCDCEGAVEPEEVMPLGWDDDTVAIAPAVVRLVGVSREAADEVVGMGRWLVIV